MYTFHTSVSLAEFTLQKYLNEFLKMNIIAFLRRLKWKTFKCLPVRSRLRKSHFFHSFAKFIILSLFYILLILFQKHSLPKKSFIVTLYLVRKPFSSLSLSFFPLSPPLPLFLPLPTPSLFAFLSFKWEVCLGVPARPDSISVDPLTSA